MNATCPACEIAQDLLTRTGQSMEAGDFDNFAECFSLPLVIETFEDSLLLQTRSDVRRTFDAVREFRARNGVVETVRENVSAKLIGDDLVAATHVSRMLTARNQLVGPPYVAFLMIRKIKGHWLIQFCQYAVDDLPELNAALSTHKEKDAAQRRRLTTTNSG